LPGKTRGEEYERERVEGPPGRSPLERHKHKLKKKRSLHLFLVINSSPLLGTDTPLLYLQLLLIDGAQKLLDVASADTRIPCHPVYSTTPAFLETTPSDRRTSPDLLRLIDSPAHMDISACENKLYPAPKIQKRLSNLGCFLQLSYLSGSSFNLGSQGPPTVTHLYQLRRI
jgi:hypothetical protein